MVSQDFMRDSGFEVGDLIELEFPDGSTHFLPLVGIVTDLSECIRIRTNDKGEKAIG